MFYPKTILTAIAAVFVFTSSFADTEIFTREGYIEQHKELAMSQMHAFNIPASIVLAQALLETGNGAGELATNANNHFGIKCKKEWTGETYSWEDDDYDENGKLIQSCFRAYPSVEDSYEDYGKFLSSRSRYGVLFTYGKDYKKWAYGLKAAGYATSSTYSENLIKIIEANQLYLYDTVQPRLITPPVRQYTQQVSEESSDTQANLIESTTTDYLRKPKEVFEMSTPVTRQTVENPHFNYELIPTVSKTEVATLTNQRAFCESPVEPTSQAMRLRPFARR